MLSTLLRLHCDGEISRSILGATQCFTGVSLSPQLSHQADIRQTLVVTFNKNFKGTLVS
jgi:hypothetical protein